MPDDVGLVQSMGSIGSAAKSAGGAVAGSAVNATAPPDISTAQAATQTALARAAQINAPEQFNATQAPIITNPFARANSELGAMNAGNSAVANAYQAKGQETPDYDKAIALQQEITRRAVQQQMAQHSFNAQDLALRTQELAQRQAAIGPDSVLKNLDLYKKYQDAGIPVPDELRQKLNIAGVAQPLSARPVDIPTTAKDSGIAPAELATVMNNPLFSGTGNGVVSVLSLADQAIKSKLSYPEFVATLEANLANTAKEAPYRQAVISAAKAHFGPMFSDYESPVAHDARIAAAAQAPATPAVPTAQQQKEIDAWNAATPTQKAMARLQGGMWQDPATGHLIVMPAGTK